MHFSIEFYENRIMMKIFYDLKDQFVAKQNLKTGFWETSNLKDYMKYLA